MATSCDFKYSRNSVKAWYIENKLIDRFMNIIDLPNFRKNVTKHSIFAKNKFGLDGSPRLFVEHNNGTVAEMNSQMLRDIDSKRAGKPSAIVTQEEVDSFYNKFVEDSERDVYIQEQKPDEQDKFIRKKYFYDKSEVSASTILERIVKRNHPMAKVASLLLDYVHQNNVTVHLVSDQLFDTLGGGADKAGFYDTDGKYIAIKENANFRGYGSEPTLVHEIIHALTYDTLRSNSKASVEFKRLYKHTLEQFKDSQEYALKDEDELIVALFTDSRFVNQLMSKKSTSSKFKNLFEELFDFIVSLFKSGAKDSLYSDLFAVASHIVADDGTNEMYQLTNNVEYTLKAVSIISNNLLKVNNWFKQLKNTDTFWNKLQKDLQVPKTQLDLLRFSDGDTIEEKLLDFASKYSFAVEMNVARYIPPTFDYEPGMPREMFYTGTDNNSQQHINLSARDKNDNVKYEGNPDWSYKEIQINTPLIEPSIKGHTAPFDNTNGIGWIRVWTNEKTGGVEIQEIQSDLFQKGRDKKDLAIVMSSKTINIENVFENEEFSFTLNNDEYESKVEMVYYEEENQTEPTERYYKNGERISFDEMRIAKEKYIESKGDIEKQNQFLQLLNKDNNWVTFFIKAAVQNFAKQGYTTIRFPKGETAAKVEGHQTIAEKTRELDKNINDLRDAKNNPEKYKILEGGIDEETGKSYMTEVYSIDLSNGNGSYTISNKEDFIQGVDAKIRQSEIQIQDLKSEGIEKLKPIEGFYEIKVGNILEKQFGKDNVKTITDEVGNEWREITIDPTRDTPPIFIQISNKQEALSNEAEDKINESISRFLEAVGFKVNPVGQITDSNGNPIDAVAKVDLLNKIISVAEDKADVTTLPEEAAHILVELLEANGDPLFDELMSTIESFPEYNEVLEEYFGIYNGNMHKIRKEAVGKVISRYIVDGKYKDRLPQTLLERILSFIKRLFGISNIDPYQKASLAIMNSNTSYLRSLVNKDISGEFYQVSNQLTRDQSLDLLDKTNKRLEIREFKVEGLKKRIHKGIYDTIERYFDMANSRIIGQRTTDRASINFINKVGGVSRAKEIQQQPYSAIMRETGTKIHDINAKIMDYVANGVGNIETIKSESGVPPTEFKKMHEAIKDMYSEMVAMQNIIDPNGKLEIRIEQKVLDEHRDIAGSIDVLVLFSDNSAVILDYKTKALNVRNTVIENNQRVIVDDIVEQYSEESYDMQLSGYSEILKDRYGIDNIRQARIIPIGVGYYTNKTTNTITKTITQIEMGRKRSQYLRPIATTAEKTEFERLNKGIADLTTYMENLAVAIEGQRDPEKRAYLIDKYNRFRKAKQDLIVDRDLASSIREAASFLAKVNSSDGGRINDLANPMTLEETEEAIIEATIHLSLLQGEVDYVNTMKDAATKARTKSNIALITQDLTTLIQDLNTRRFDDLKKLEIDRGVDIDVPGRELATSDWFSSTSEIDHPVFRAAWRNYEDARLRAKRQSDKLNDEISEELALYQKWASSVGLHGTKVFDPIYNPETGNLIRIYSEKLKEDIGEAKSRRDVDAVKRILRLKPGYREKYERNLATYISKVEQDMPDFITSDGTKISREAERQSQITKYKRYRNPNSNEFWLSDNTEYHTEVQDIYKEHYYSKEYKYILANPEAKRFYDFYLRKTAEFREIIGFDKIPYNFVGNIRSSMLEAFVNKSIPRKAFKDVMFGSIYARQDGIMGKVDAITGEPIDVIPVMFTNPLLDSNGNIDVSEKSRDLGKILYLFGTSVYNFQYKSEIEAEVNALRDFLISNSNGEIVTDSANKPARSRSGKIVRRKLSPTATVSMFDRHRKFHLYGQKVQSKDMTFKVFGAEISTNKLISVIKQYYSMKVLAFSVIPPTAAFGSGMFNTLFEASKGIHFTKKDIMSSVKLLATQDKKAKFLSKFIEPYQENMTYRNARNLSVNTVTKTIGTDTFFKTYSFADERLDDIITTTISKTYGIDEDGNIYRLSEAEIKQGGKSVYDKISFDKDSGDIKGLTEEGYAQLRRLIRKLGKSIKGQMTEEEIMAINTMMFGQVLMQFKNWMPGLIQERFGKIKYDDDLMQFRQGRYSVAASELFFVNDELNSLSKSVAIGIGKLMADALIFWKPIYKVDEKKAKILYDEFITNNSDNLRAKNMTLEKFILMRQAQMRATAHEMRAALVVLALISMLAGDWDDDGEKDYRKYWFTRKLFNVFTRAQSELALFYDPSQAPNWIRSMIPMAGIANDLLKGAENVKNELKYLVKGEREPHDHTGFMYYFWDWVLLDKVMALLEKANRDNTQN